jgi:hypothetical protein
MVSVSGYRLCTWIHISSKIYFLSKPLHSTLLRLKYKCTADFDIVNFAAGNLHNCVFPFRQAEASSKYHRKCLSWIFRGVQDFLTPKLSRAYVFTNVGRTICMEITWEFLKEQCHEIFCFWFFSWIIFPRAPENNTRVITNFFENSRRYSQLKEWVGGFSSAQNCARLILLCVKTRGFPHSSFPEFSTRGLADLAPYESRFFGRHTVLFPS